MQDPADVLADAVAKEDQETAGPSAATGRLLGRPDVSRRAGDEDQVEDERQYEGEGIVGDDEFD